MTRQNKQNAQLVDVAMRQCSKHGEQEHYVQRRTGKGLMYTCVLCKRERNRAYRAGTSEAHLDTPWRVIGDVKGNQERLIAAAERRRLEREEDGEEDICCSSHGGNGRIWSLDGIGAELHASPRTVRRWIQDGMPVEQAKPGGLISALPGEIHAWLRMRGKKPEMTG